MGVRHEFHAGEGLLDLEFLILLIKVMQVIGLLLDVAIRSDEEA